MNAKLPGIEARVGAQECQGVFLHARIEELAQTMATSSKEFVEQIFDIDRHMDVRFNKVDGHFDRTDGRIEELSRDMTVSFKQLAAYQMQTEQKIDTRFDNVETRLDKIEANMATKADIANMATKDDIVNMATKADIANMATKDDIANMATKDDMNALEVRLQGNIDALETRMDAMEVRLQGNMNAMEGRILDAFKQLVAEIDLRLPPRQIGEAG